MGLDRSSRRRRGTKRAGALALLGAAMSVVALGMSAGPAAAAVTTSAHFSFLDFNNVQHTCTIQMVREQPYANDSQVGRGATTMVSGGDPYCTDGVAYIGATYKDPDGLDVTTEENSDGPSTARRYAPIGSDFTTVHSVQYFSCQQVSLPEDCRFTQSRTK